MMGEECQQHPGKSAETIGSSPVSFYLDVENVDEVFRIGLDAGAKVLMPVQDMFWGGALVLC